MSQGTSEGVILDQPLMTIRVSYDSGQTWEPERAVFNSDDLPPLVTAEWPPCRCLRCMGRRSSSDL